MSRHHLAVVCEYSTLNGGEQSLLSVLDDVAFRTASLRVSILVPPGGRFADAVHSRGLDFVPFQLTDDTGARLPREGIQHRLIETLRSLAPDVVHANSLSMGRLLGSVRSDVAGLCLSHIRDIVGLSGAAVRDLNRLDRIVAVSQATRAFHIAQGVCAEKIGVIYNGVDTERFSPGACRSSVRRELNLPPDAFLVASIGQIGLRKGQDILADAAVSLRDRFPHLHYLFVGERNSSKDENVEFEQRLHRRFDEGGLAKRVHFLGYRADVPDLLREVDLLVHAARQEPFGRVLLEAGASGVPIVATDVGGTREMFPVGEAVLIPPDDADTLARAMAEVIGDDDRRHRLGEAARRRIVESFAVSRAATSLLGLWRSFLA